MIDAVTTSFPVTHHEPETTPYLSSCLGTPRSATTTDAPSEVNAIGFYGAIVRNKKKLGHPRPEGIAGVKENSPRRDSHWSASPLERFTHPRRVAAAFLVPM
ncbi:MAG: hypothetical protein ACRD1X_04650 [Vicinamibacteria bacterium]